MKFTTKLRTLVTALTSNTKTVGAQVDPLASKFR